MKATLLEVIIIGVDGVFEARTTAGAGTYTKSGGTMSSDLFNFRDKDLGFISGIWGENLWRRGIEKFKRMWKKG